MAIFTPGIAVAAISGSVGGSTFSRNRGGQYIRRRAIPTRSTTSFATNAKARLAHASQEWQSLSAPQKLSWEQYADANPATNALGNQVTLGGAMMYSRFHTRADLAGQTPLVVPPIIAAPPSLESLSLVADVGAGDIIITYTATPLAAADRCWIRAAVVSSAGIQYVENLYRLTDLTVVASASPLTITTEVEARLGTLTVGQTLHLLVSTFSNTSMLKSLPLKVSAVVTST